MKEISLPETAYQILLKESEPIKFVDLFAKVCEIGELSEEEKAQFIGHFYTDLSLDGRFVALVDNTWDLRSRHTYDKVHIDVNDVYSEVDEAEQDAEDLEEERAYNAAVEGRTYSEDLEEEEDEEKGNDSDEAAELVGFHKENKMDY